MSDFLVIVEGRATSLASQAIDERILQQKSENAKKNLKNVKGRGLKRGEEEQDRQKTNRRKRSKASTLYNLTPDRPPLAENTGSRSSGSSSSSSSSSSS